MSRLDGPGDYNLDFTSEELIRGQSDGQAPGRDEQKETLEGNWKLIFLHKCREDSLPSCGGSKDCGPYLLKLVL